MLVSWGVSGGSEASMGGVPLAGIIQVRISRSEEPERTV